MASRVGRHLFQRFSRMYTSDSIARAHSISDLLKLSQFATESRRACVATISFDSGSRNSQSHTSSQLPHVRYFCHAPKDVHYNDRPDKLEDPSPDNVVSTSNDEPDTYKPSKRHDLAMLFTCKVCETRSAKTMSRATYETGIVIVRCPKCRNLHLIADRLGWFGEPGSVEDFLKEQGVSVRKGLEETYEFSVEEMVGWTPPSTSAKH